MKKSMLLVLSAILLFSFALAGCGSKSGGSESGGVQSGDAPSGESGGKKLKVGMVTDMGSVNDKSFNQSAWEGLQKLKKDFGYEVKYLEPKNDAEVIPSLNQFVKNKYDLTWATAETLDAAIKQIASENPDAKLGIIDAGVEVPNVASVLFKENEGAFLVGVIAGLMTKSNKIGFVGGMEIPVIKRFEAGFREGIKAVNPDATFKPLYTGQFVRVDMGKSAASTLYNEGVDIIFHASGLTGNGVFNEAKERAARGEQVWVIGVDKDQSLEFGDEITLTSMIKKVDEAVYQISKDLADGKFPDGKITYMGLKEKGVDVAPTSSKNVPQDILDKVEQYRQQIIEGKIQVPTT
ncbi:BMP family lipoprotein [Paenibacillus apiarius]|uniref:BMP family ABC transporter substrate-binding protein n=1 Tax=Paenibacillus apiarius TaxID=46240 RepID=A0ABT4E147_9BACL|nr:BMP family ABC transporter substrate-binding protein [Paenibacillus apiarius]MBN3522927.1 BMP family ABC transporter substrate-binding protein [Paenibacillus apiarius]MCY9514912.1 BMP family ABC transporter substrate-binding protein [Paenibacillus apiarius]MCY9523328.1 BMP family ABC transporter substrate-binding protein [Paenibacillus apiarius]MCY9554156.1 BMP family ABC transporter substrate-binding protein [Paenibacillus apiarius]MCY9559434.1 BMP family ABC transporter substrate-binding 